MPKRVLIAVDKFKGSMSAGEVAAAVEAGLREAGHEAWEVDRCPIADGGEGTCEAVVGALGGEWVDVATEDALGRPLVARYGWVKSSAGAEAVMEMSAASGLALVLDRPLDPWRASTRGTGWMLRDAMQRGAARIRIGIGGSATNDGGMGLAAALGYRFLDHRGRIVERLPECFDQVTEIRRPESAVRMPAIEVACDVDNPLLGERGATRVYGAQKGVTELEMTRFEERLERLADLVSRDLGVDPREVPGAGAAGGLGFGLMAFCAARLTSGFELVAEAVGLAARVAAADVVITGEGRMDAQTLNGKGPVGVARLAKAAGKVVVGVGGSIQVGVGLEQEFDFLVATKPSAMPLAEAIARGASLLVEAVAASSGAWLGKA